MLLINRRGGTVPDLPAVRSAKQAMSKIVKVGIVGAGHRGGSFVDELLKIPDCKLTALCDVSEENLGLFDRRWHLSDTLKTTDLQRMLAGDLVDAVIITVPDRWHREVAEACFAAGKDVMLEKPMAPTAADCKAIIEARRRSGRMVQLGFVLRCTNFYRKVKEIIDSGRLGQVMSINACEYLSVAHGMSYMTRWHRKKENNGGFLLAKNSHDLDILNWLTGSLPTHVASFGDNNFFLPSRSPSKTCTPCPRNATCRFRWVKDWHYITGATAEPGSDICVFNDDKDVVDNQIVILEYANQIRATFSLQLFHPGKDIRHITITGSEAYLTGTLETNRVRVHYNHDRHAEEFDTTPTDQSGHSGGDSAFTREFVEAVRHQTPPVVDLAAGYHVNVIAEAIEKARIAKQVMTLSTADYECPA